MKAVVFVAFLSVLGTAAYGQYAGTIFPYYQKNGQVFSLQETTTPNPQISTESSMSPHTSVSVHHTIVRNKPAYPYPYTESSMQSEGSEDTSYYYTYEDTSEETGKKSFTTPLPTTSTTVKTVRSFWNSQKALLDARRKEGAQKFMPTYSKPTPRIDTKPKIEFKVREKPKFGLANKNKEALTDSELKKENVSQNVQSTTPKSVKFNKNEANLADEKGSEKDEVAKDEKSTSLPLQNQIVGRVGEIPIQNKFATLMQSNVLPQNNFGTSRQSKFDESTGNMQYIDNVGNYQQPIMRNHLNPLPPLANTGNPQTVRVNKLDPFLVDLSKQPLSPNQQSILSTNQQLQNSIQALLNSNQQAILNTNQQPLLNTNNQQPLLRSNQQQLLNTNSLPLLNNIQQQSLDSINRPPVTAFISASPGDTAATRTADQYVNTNNPASSLLQRLGSLGLNLGSGDLGGGGLILGRDGGHGPSGLTFNLGPVPDPLSILLKLLSLLPRPLLDLNGRLFFGIELGKNAGLVSGAIHKPVGKPIG